jgi:pilus assembly protein Flp/PilA
LFNRPFSALIDASSVPSEFDFHRGAGMGRCVARERSILMRQLFSKFVGDQSGATAIEYCLIASGIAMAIITAVNGVGVQLNTKFSSINSSLK